MHRFDWKSARHVRKLLWLLTPLFATMLWLLLGMGALLFPNLLTPSVSAENAARQLLHICRLWYVLLAVVLLAGFPILYLAGRLACRKLSGVAGAQRMPAAAFVCLIFPCLLIWAVIQYGGLPGRFFQAGADLKEIDTGYLVQAEVWISPKSAPAHLPGPYTERLAEVTTRYGILGDGTDPQWVTVYVPCSMGFSLDPDRLFDETQTISWNREHAQRYLVRYTSQFHFVTELTPID